MKFPSFLLDIFQFDQPREHKLSYWKGEAVLLKDVLSLPAETPVTLVVKTEGRTFVWYEKSLCMVWNPKGQVDPFFDALKKHFTWTVTDVAKGPVFLFHYLRSEDQKFDGIRGEVNFETFCVTLPGSKHFWKDGEWSVRQDDKEEKKEVPLKFDLQQYQSLQQDTVQIPALVIRHLLSQVMLPLEHIVSVLYLYHSADEREKMYKTLNNPAKSFWEMEMASFPDRMQVWETLEDHEAMQDVLTLEEKALLWSMQNVLNTQ